MELLTFSFPPFILIRLDQSMVTAPQFQSLTKYDFLEMELNIAISKSANSIYEAFPLHQRRRRYKGKLSTMPFLCALSSLFLACKPIVPKI